jgi:hypothetical protein
MTQAMSIHQQVAPRRHVHAPDTYRALQVLLYVLAATLTVVTSLYAYA